MHTIDDSPALTNSVAMANRRTITCAPCSRRGKDRSSVEEHRGSTMLGAPNSLVETCCHLYARRVSCVTTVMACSSLCLV